MSSIFCTGVGFAKLCYWFKILVHTDLTIRSSTIFLSQSSAKTKFDRELGLGHFLRLAPVAKFYYKLGCLIARP